jgi:hypothetical protein
MCPSLTRAKAEEYAQKCVDSLGGAKKMQEDSGGSVRTSSGTLSPVPAPSRGGGSSTSPRMSPRKESKSPRKDKTPPQTRKEPEKVALLPVFILCSSHSSFKGDSFLLYSCASHSSFKLLLHCTLLSFSRLLQKVSFARSPRPLLTESREKPEKKGGVLGLFGKRKEGPVDDGVVLKSSGRRSKDNEEIDEGFG